MPSPSVFGSVLGAVIVVIGILLYLWFLLLPIFIYWRCGRILQRLERLEQFFGTTRR
jgi:hypothetical protein